MQLTHGEKKKMRRRELRSKSSKIQVRHAEPSEGSLIKNRGENLLTPTEERAKEQVVKYGHRAAAVGSEGDFKDSEGGQQI